MIKAIVFDCFGVLATEAWLPFKAKYFGHDPVLLEQVTEITHQADSGLISRQDAIAATAKLAGITPQAFTQAIGTNVPDDELFAYIRGLKPNYKIGFLSNISDNYLHQIFTPDYLALFDAICLSFELGFIKPHPRAYELTAGQLGVEPEECVMIDDQPRNVAGAEAAGMNGILYQNVDQLKAELAPLLKS